MADQSQNLRETPANQESAKTPKARPKRLRVIAVASGKGGVGKSNVAVNMALAYTQLGKRVVIFDADLGFANINVLLGIVPAFNLYHVINGSKKLSEIVVSTGFEGLQLVAGLSGFGEIGNLDENERESILEQLNYLAYVDVLIIDTAPGANRETLSFLSIADQIILLTVPEPTSMTDAYSLLKVLSVEAQNVQGEIQLVVNRSASVKEAKSVATRIVSLSKKYLKKKVSYLGFIYEDPLVGQMVRRQKPFIIENPSSRASRCLRYLVNRIENVDTPEENQLQSLFGRMFNRFPITPNPEKE